MSRIGLFRPVPSFKQAKCIEFRGFWQFPRGLPAVCQADRYQPIRAQQLLPPTNAAGRHRIVPDAAPAGAAAPRVGGRV